MVPAQCVIDATSTIVVAHSAENGEMVLRGSGLCFPMTTKGDIAAMVITPRFSMSRAVATDIGRASFLSACAARMRAGVGLGS